MKYKQIYAVRMYREMWVPFKGMKICIIISIVIVKINIEMTIIVSFNYQLGKTFKVWWYLALHGECVAENT